MLMFDNRSTANGYPTARSQNVNPSDTNDVVGGPCAARAQAVGSRRRRQPSRRGRVRRRRSAMHSEEASDEIGAQG